MSPRAPTPSPASTAAVDSLATGALLASDVEGAASPGRRPRGGARRGSRSPAAPRMAGARRAAGGDEERAEAARGGCRAVYVRLEGAGWPSMQGC